MDIFQGIEKFNQDRVSFPVFEKSFFKKKYIFSSKK